VKASIFLNKHAVDMLNENFVFFERFWKNLPSPPLNYGVFDLFGPLTIFFPNFARRGRIRKSSNFDPIFGKTNRIRSARLRFGFEGVK